MWLQPTAFSSSASNASVKYSFRSCIVSVSWESSRTRLHCADLDGDTCRAKHGNAKIEFIVVAVHGTD